MSEPILDLAQAYGIARDYKDQTKRTHDTSPETARALLQAMGIDAGSDAEIQEQIAAFEQDRITRPLPKVLICTAGSRFQLKNKRWQHWVFEFENGEEMEGLLSMPCIVRDMPMGIHRLRYDGLETTVLAAPRALPLPKPGWGVTLPLYGLRTEEEGGFGDYADLAAAVGGLGQAGAGFVGINPIHAGFAEDALAFSPYAPSSRRRLNTQHIPTGPSLTKGALIDYPAALAEKYAALETEFAAFQGNHDFEAFLTNEGAALTRFATHQALSEVHGPYWTDWPASYQNYETAAVTAFATENPTRIRYHAWLQWRAEIALGDVRAAAEAAEMPFGLYLDLAVGVHPKGAQTWLEREVFAPGVSLGAPPDAFSAEGQTWGLAPLNPRTLIDAGLRPFAEILRKQLQFSKLLRIDHVLGFERAFWVPEGDVPGGYVKMPRAAMIAITKIEAARAGATVIGEDLGNIPDGLQSALAEAGLLGCRVAMFEQDYDGDRAFFAPEAYPAQSLAAFGTHDLPTYHGWRAGRDIDWRAKLGSMDAASAEAAKAERVTELAAFDKAVGASDPDINDMHGFLARSGACLVAAQAEDILGAEEQANLPGTVHEHPNWRRRLSVTAAEIGTHPAVRATADIMRREGR